MPVSTLNQKLAEIRADLVTLVAAYNASCQSARALKVQKLCLKISELMMEGGTDKIAWPIEVETDRMGCTTLKRHSI